MLHVLKARKKNKPSKPTGHEHANAVHFRTLFVYAHIRRPTRSLFNNLSRALASTAQAFPLIWYARPTAPGPVVCPRSTSCSSGTLARSAAISSFRTRACIGWKEQLGRKPASFNDLPVHTYVLLAVLSLISGNIQVAWSGAESLRGRQVVDGRVILVNTIQRK